MANEKVLIIDDGRENVVFLANQVLKPHGYQVITASDGEAGLQKALGEDPDLIITDVRMPKMSGIEVLRELDKAGKSIPTIIATFHGSEELAIEAFRLGARDYLIKPYEIEDMLQALDRALTPQRRFREEKNALQDNVAQANRQLERRVRELQILSGIGKAVTSLLNLEKVLQRIAEAATFLTGAEEAFLMLIDPESGDLQMRAVQGMGKKFAHFRQKVDDSVAGQVIRTGKPVRMNRGDKDKTLEMMTGYLVRDLLNVPLKVRDKVIGVLGVDNVVDREGFSESHEYLLSALADYAAIAIDNSRLYELMAERAVQLTRLVSSKKDESVDSRQEVEALRDQLRAREEQLGEARAQAGTLAEQVRALAAQLDGMQARLQIG